MLLAHPTDCRKYCECDQLSGAICERNVPPGTRFNGATQGFVHDDECLGSSSSITSDYRQIWRPI